MSSQIPGLLSRSATDYTLAAEQFLEPAEYCQLAISARRLVRCDDAMAGLRGLLDPATGERFMTEEAKLRSYQVRAFAGR